MIKLKKLLKEGFAWERKFGEPLPTLDSVQRQYQSKNTVETSVCAILEAKKLKVPQPSDFGGNMDKYLDALNMHMKDVQKLVK